MAQLKNVLLLTMNFAPYNSLVVTTVAYLCQNLRNTTACNLLLTYPRVKELCNKITVFSFVFLRFNILNNRVCLHSATLSLQKILRHYEIGQLDDNQFSLSFILISITLPPSSGVVTYG